VRFIGGVLQMKYEDIKDFTQRCEEHPGHQTGMVSYQMIQDRLSEEIDELRAYIEQRTPEETLDWLADQHRAQCGEDRPVQHWIRKMKEMLL
jgi:hypothetical protein